MWMDRKRQYMQLRRFLPVKEIFREGMDKYKGKVLKRLNRVIRRFKTRLNIGYENLSIK